jgi:peptidoglycan/LPS O-acetylase OafA/YrhL
MRRILRIWPLYYAVLIAVVLLDFPGVGALFPWVACHLANIGSASINQPWICLSHYWSLSVEEQFYLVWPLIVFFAPRRSLLVLAAAAVVLAPVSRLGLLLLFRNRPEFSYIMMTSCLDGLGMGAVLALTSHVPQSRRVPALRLSLVTGLLMLAVIMVFRLLGVARSLQMAVEPLALSLTFAWVIQGAAEGFAGLPGRILTLGPLLYLGRISYGLYVLHLPVSKSLEIVGQVWNFPPAITSIIELPGFTFVGQSITTIIVASFSWFLLERPFNRLKDYFPYPRPAAAVRIVDRGQELSRVRSRN